MPNINRKKNSKRLQELFKKIISYLLKMRLLFGLRYKFLILIAFGILHHSHCLLKRKLVRSITGGDPLKGVSAPVLDDEIDLETIEGIEQVAKLVLIKTDSLPRESDERIDGRYLSSMMETLYTGLRKPFKSVSADILGIFPSFEEIQVRCDRTSSNEHIERENESSTNKLHSSDENKDNWRSKLGAKEENLVLPEEHIGPSGIEKRNESSTIEIESSYASQTTYKSSSQVCRAVTSDCLSMDNLAQILPPTISSFDKALVRLCPIMLFRIMNHLCHKTSNSLSNRRQEEFISSYRDDVEAHLGQTNNKDSITLNTLLRETQLLKNLQNSDDLGSKKPQKLHKKLKTQTSYKSNGRLIPGSLQQHGSVDEQLLKLRLKLTEPSIEKVWIFSLLFVILSIVVSMGGLIVLPFVKKTTRRRILTLFEGLAVGGLAGSATLHMFPQAFGLVDENYHKYFWRIFVVFFGIYICYLCERIIKILKVMRARVRRHSRASLIDMDFRYGFSSVSREISKNRSSRLAETDHDHDVTVQSNLLKKKNFKKSRSKNSQKECIDCRFINSESVSTGSKEKKSRIKSFGQSSSIITRDTLDRTREMSASDIPSLYTVQDPDSISLDINQTNPTRQRLVQCLKSVQQQFSPVYAVRTQNIDGTAPSKDEPRAGRLMRLTSYQESSKMKKRARPSADQGKNRNHKPRSLFGILRKKDKPSIKKYLKQRDVETMLYHQRMIGRHGRGRAGLDRGYLEQRLSSVNDVAAERQDQDNAARMSVDTVAWMIVFGDAVLNVIDGLSIGAAFERNILAGISISVAVMLEEVTHRLGTFAVLIRAGMSMQQSLLCTFVSACALFPGLIVGILLSDATEDATPYIFCAAGGIFLYMVSHTKKKISLMRRTDSNTQYSH